MKSSIVVFFCLLASAASAANPRTFQSLTITPASTNITAGATVLTTVALGTKASSGSTASGAVILYVGSISPPDSTITTGLNPNSYTIGTSATNNSTLTVTTTTGTPANTYVIYVVGSTNPSAGGNLSTPITNTFTMTVTSAAADLFSMSVSPASTNVFKGVATNVNATVNFVDYSATLSGVVTNGVTVSPPGQGVTASLNSIYAPVTNNFGQTNLVLTMSATANATAGTYQVIVRGTNGNFTANSPTPGIASITNTFTVTDLNSFSLSVSPTSTNVFAGIATNVAVTVTFTDNSPVLSEVLTNGASVSPAGQGVTASLNNNFVSVNSGGGQGTLTLTINAAANTAPGTYQVVVSATNSDFTANSPVPGIASVTNIFVVVEPPAPPSIQTFNLSGATLTIAGANGIPSGQYVVMASTNLTLPLAQWTPVITNAFDGSGNFNASFGLTNTLSPNAAQQFFILLQETNLGPAVAAPIFSPAAGPFFAATPVTITSATSGALIRYTTDGSAPTESNGILYTGPVTMLSPVDTNQSGFVTNASGVTMLKAIAYKSGMPDSAVWTGIYSILDAVDHPPAPAPSPLVGVAHIAYNVSSSNWDNIVSLWTNYFGFAPMMVSNNFVLIKINDQQFVEMYKSPMLVSNQWQLANFGFEVTNAEVYREQLAANGVSVPPGVTTNLLGNLSFVTVDPDGHTNEWIQYLTNSITGLSQGQYMPGTILAGFANDVGICTTDETLNLPHNYYVTQCGFQGSGNEVYFPSGGKRYIELLTAGPGGATQATAGKHGKIQFMNFRGMDLFQTLNILTNRNPSIPVTLSVEGTTNSILHNAADFYDLDGSRIRINDE